jgi:hypothetical protein
LRGQPFDSKRHSVVCQMEALSPLPWTKTMGGNSVMEGPVAQAVVSSAPVSAMNWRRVVVMFFCLL